MRPSRWTVRRTSLGVGATAAVAATALATGLVSPASGPQTGRLAPLLGTPVAAATLDGFADCEELRRWYVDATLPHVTAWGLGGPVVPLMAAEQALPTAGTADARSAETDVDTAVGSGPTGTNVQEAGVDEPDTAKTDGRLVAHVAGGRGDRPSVVLTDVSGEAPLELSRLRLPRGLSGAELLLVGDRLVVLGTAWHQGPILAESRSLPVEGFAEGTTRALVVDVGDPRSPRIEDDASFSGDLVAARLHDGVVRLVLTTSTPALDFVQPRRGRTRAEALRENRRRVRESDIADWLPTVERGGAPASLLDCSDVRHPKKASGYGTVSVVAFDPADPQTLHSTAVTTSSDLVYSSTDRMYLATTYRRGSDVHAFGLDDASTRYVASGTVPGTVRDRWSMSEYDGDLRVATALGRDVWDPDENAVVVLRERGDRLAEVGRVGAMGIREQIRSVRWFGELAVVVTFRQVDPLYTVDLSDPEAPRVLGELKIPGFSAYLHPVGDDLVLGLGQDASRDGRTRGAQAAVFDLRDLGAPRRVDVEGVGAETDFVASYDPRAFTYLPASRTVLATVDDWRDGVRVVAMRIGEDGELTRLRDVRVGGWNSSSVRPLPLDDERVALVARGRVRLLTP